MIRLKRGVCPNFRIETVLSLPVSWIASKRCNCRDYSTLNLTDWNQIPLLTRKLYSLNSQKQNLNLLSKEPNLSHKETGLSNWALGIGSIKDRFLIKIPFRTSFQPAYRKKVNLKHIMAEKEDWLTLGDIRVYPWSISGLDTCITVKMEDKLQVAFDMGYAYREATRCPNVFISHGHIDHVSGLIQHASRRELYSMKPATYHVLPHLVSGIRTVAQGFMDMHENMNSFKDMHLNPVEVGDTVHLPNNYIVRSFPTKHRVRSQGYILYKVKKTLREDFKGLPGKEIGELVRDGVVVSDVVETPMVAYTGDTTFEVYQELYNPDLLKVKLLITEATYIDDDFDSQGRNNVQKARDRGHSHLREFIDNSWLFRDVENILLIHFSDKYSVDYIHETVDNSLPSFMRPKFHLGTLAKEKFG